jgi:hypothetical protein
MVNIRRDTNRFASDFFNNLLERSHAGGATRLQFFCYEIPGSSYICNSGIA